MPLLGGERTTGGLCAYSGLRGQLIQISCRGQTSASPMFLKDGRLRGGGASQPRLRIGITLKSWGKSPMSVGTSHMPGMPL